MKLQLWINTNIGAKGPRMAFQGHKCQPQVGQLHHSPGAPGGPHPHSHGTLQRVQSISYSSKFTEAIGTAQVSNGCGHCSPRDCQEEMAQTGQRAPASPANPAPPDLLGNPEGSAE